MPLSRLLALALLGLSTTGFARDVSPPGPAFPRIGNCYGAGLGSRAWEDGKGYWSKLDLFIGGGYDLHYDWERPNWKPVLERVAANIARIREVNPTALFLPYVDVIEGPDNPTVAQNWWALNEKGERWSGWPGYFRINTGLPEVLQYNLDRVREEVLGRECFDGVFYDCWSPDKWLVPETAKLRNEKALVMVNAGNLPASGFESLNGCLAEDEINRVVGGKVEFEEFLSRYLRWSREGRKPCTTMLVCRPQALNDDPWRWAKMTHEQRTAETEQVRAADEQTMRFGLATTLMGDGYFGYDAGTAGRGNWWWYREYDAPLGYPKGECRHRDDGTWQRDFDGGTVVVNGSAYDVVVELAEERKDVSTGRVGTRFTVPMLDGRILLPTDEPVTVTADVAPRVTRTPPREVRATKLPGAITAIQTPGGLDLRVDAKGALQSILWQGEPLMSGGWPVVAAPPFDQFEAVPDPAQSRVGPPPPEGPDGNVGLRFGGVLERDVQKAAYSETILVGPPARFTLHFDFEARTDLDLRMWRHYFMLPASRFAGARVVGDAVSVGLPETLGEEQLVPSAREFKVRAQRAALEITSSIPLGLVDHRKWGTQEFLLAGYPVSGKVPQGTRWSVELTVAVR